MNESNNMREVSIREYKASPDMEVIRKVAGNPDLSANEVFDFGTFMICKSGVNRNQVDISSEGQKSAVNGWIGKAILYRDHEKTTSNQIGRIYQTWIVENGKETITYGRGYGVHTSDLQDIFKKIENGINREMSCGYELVKSVCSNCHSDLTGDRFNVCNKGHKVGHDGVYAKDVSFNPDHISFVASPAVEGAGLVAASADLNKILRIFGETATVDNVVDKVRELKHVANDGYYFRAWCSSEFHKWYGLSNPDVADEEIGQLASKLTTREMMRLARIEKDRMNEVFPVGGKQMSIAAEPEETDKPKAEPISLKEIRNSIRKSNK